RGVALQVNATAPPELLLHGSSNTPARANVKLAVRQGEAATARTERLALGLQAEAFDLEGRRAKASVQLNLGATTVTLVADEKPLELHALSLRTSAAARGTRYTVQDLELRVDELLRLTLSGAV